MSGVWIARQTCKLFCAWYNIHFFIVRMKLISVVAIPSSGDYNCHMIYACTSNQLLTSTNSACTRAKKKTSWRRCQAHVQTQVRKYGRKCACVCVYVQRTLLDLYQSCLKKGASSSILSCAVCIILNSEFWVQISLDFASDVNCDKLCYTTLNFIL